MFAQQKSIRMKNFIFIGVIALLFSCGGGEGTATSGSKDMDGEIVPGYKYVNHTKKGGDVPKDSEYAYFNYYIMDGDSLMISNRNQGKPQFTKIDNDFSGSKIGQKPLMLALQKMAIGDSLSLFLPKDSLPAAYQTLKNDVLSYHIALVDIKDEASFLEESEALNREMQKEIAANQARESEIAEMVSLRASEYVKGSLDSKIKTAPSGLKYMVHEEGNGVKPQQGQMVFAHYYGALTDGTPFDNSFKRGQPLNFPLGQRRVIPGWDEGFALLSPGAKATLFVPSEMAYGERGSAPIIPPNAELIFYVEFVSIQ